MTSTKSLGVLSACVLGIGGPTGISYINSQESFWDYVSKVCLHEDVKNGDWKKAQDKFISQDQESYIRSTEFKSLKQQLIAEPSIPEKKTGKYLKELCVNTYPRIYKSWLLHREALLSDLNAFCSLKIQDKIDASKRFNFSENAEQAEIKTKLEELQKHNPEIDGILLEPFISLKQSNKANNSEDQEKLWKWCKETYLKPYLGKISNNDFKLTKKYCQRT